MISFNPIQICLSFICFNVTLGVYRWFTKLVIVSFYLYKIKFYQFTSSV